MENTSNDSFSVYGPKRDSLYVVIPITIIYGIIFVTGLTGNITTCIVIAKNKPMHTPTNYYLFSLAISDLLLLVSGLPPEMYQIWSRYPYVFGYTFCVLTGFFSETSANATVLTITAFTIERYLAICHPFLSHTLAKLSRITKLIIFIWIVAICFAIPQALQLGIHRSVEEDPETTMCIIISPSIKHSFEISTILFFFAPMVLITVLYILIAVNLMNSPKILSEDSSDSKMIRGKRPTRKIVGKHQNNQSSRRVLKMLGSECKKRWKSMRDHYKREKREEKGTTGKAAKKKRAIYWQRLQFLDTVEDERNSFTNVLTPSSNEASIPTSQPRISEVGEHEEDDPHEQSSQHSSHQESSPKTGTSTPSADGQRSDSAVRPLSKTRKESVTLQKYLIERQQEKEHLKRYMEQLIHHPEPQEDEIDMFFKTMAVTVKKFRPDLVTRTKASVFNVVTEMELLNLQSSFSHTTGFTNIQYNENHSLYSSASTSSFPRTTGFTNIQYNENQSLYSPESTSSPWTTPHSSHTEASSDIVSQALAQTFQTDGDE